MYERIRRLLVDSLDVDAATITPETPLKSLIRDSLDLVDMVMLFEEIWEIEMSDQAVGDRDVLSMTVGELADFLEQHGKGTA